MSVAALKQIKWLTHTLEGVKLTSTQKNILMQLADDHNEDMGCAWPSVSKLALRIPLSDKQCRRVLKDLAALKVIESRPRLRDENDVRRSNEYRFWFDPPFDKANALKTEKRLRLAALNRQQRPVQTMLNGFLGTPTDGSTVLPPASPPYSLPQAHRTPTGGGKVLPPTGVRELLEEPPNELSLEPSNELKSEPPTPLRGKGTYLNRVDNYGRNARFDQLKLMLKSELLSIPGKLAAAKGFEEVQPGQNDYVTCFEHWFLDAVKALPNGLIVMTWTDAEHGEAVAKGVEKYRERLVRLARRYFEEPVKPISFKLEVVRREAGEEQTAPAALVAAVPEPGRIQHLAATADPAHVVQDAWSQVKDELVREATARMSPQAWLEFERNYKDAILPARLLKEDRAGGVPAWLLTSANAKKTQAVLALYRRQVGAAVQAITGGEVTLVVVGQGGAR